MVTAPAAAPPLVGVKKVVPVELLESNSVTGAPALATGLPNWSWTWTANGPTVAVVPTLWLPDTVVVKVSLLAFPTTMVKPLVEVPVTAWALTVAPARLMVGVPGLVSE